MFWSDVRKRSRCSAIAAIWFLSLRLLMSVAAAPIMEELFWRGWMMRRNIKFQSGATVPTRSGLWLRICDRARVVLGCGAGDRRNLQVRAMRTKSLTEFRDNACLAVYVIGWQQWQFCLQGALSI